MQNLIYLIKIIGYLLLWIIGMGLAVELVNSIYLPKEIYGIMLTSLISATFTIGLTFLWIHYVEKSSIAGIGLSLRNRAKDIGYSVLLGFVIMAVFAGLFIILKLTILEPSPFDIEKLIVSFFTFIFVSFTEEVMSRGYFQRAIQKKLNRWWALGIASFVFAILHAANPNVNLLSLFNIFLAGLVLGVNYSYTGNLWFALGLHFSWNFFQGPIFGFAVSGTDDFMVFGMQIPKEPYWLSGGYFGFEGSIFATIVLLAYFIFAVRYFEKKEKKIWQTIA